MHVTSRAHVTVWVRIFRNSVRDTLCWTEERGCQKRTEGWQVCGGGQTQPPGDGWWSSHGGGEGVSRGWERAVVLQVGIISRDKVRTCLCTGAWLQTPSLPPPDHTCVFHCLLSSTGWEQLPFSLLHSGFHLKHGAGAPKEVEIEKKSSEGPLGTRYPLYLLPSGANFS